MQIRNTIAAVIDVHFEDPERVRQQCIEGDWAAACEYIPTLNQLAQYIAISIEKNEAEWSPALEANVVNVPGLPPFIELDAYRFVASPAIKAKCGDITIEYQQELDITDSRLIEEESSGSPIQAT